VFFALFVCFAGMFAFFVSAFAFFFAFFVCAELVSLGVVNFVVTAFRRAVPAFGCFFVDVFEFAFLFFLGPWFWRFFLDDVFKFCFFGFFFGILFGVSFFSVFFKGFFKDEVFFFRVFKEFFCQGELVLVFFDDFT